MSHTSETNPHALSGQAFDLFYAVRTGTATSRAVLFPSAKTRCNPSAQAYTFCLYILTFIPVLSPLSFFPRPGQEGPYMFCCPPEHSCAAGEEPFYHRSRASKKAGRSRPGLSSLYSGGFRIRLPSAPMLPLVFRIHMVGLKYPGRKFPDIAKIPDCLFLTQPFLNLHINVLGVFLQYILLFP